MRIRFPGTSSHGLWTASWLVLLAGCVSSEVPRPYVAEEIAGRAMGTTWSVQVVPDAAGQDIDALRLRIAARLDAIEDEMSHWREDSVVSVFNRTRSQEPVPVSSELAEVIATALTLHRQSNGAFDITAAPLVNLWGFGPTEPPASPPNESQISAALAHVDSRSLRLVQHDDGGWTLAKTDAAVQLDLSSLAKGYAIDRIAEDVRAAGYPRYLVELGGELRAAGDATTGQPWRVGLERPDPRRVGHVRRVLVLDDAAVATSGNYRLFRHAGSDTPRPAAHLIDPRTGRSPRHDLVSVSVVASTAMEADAWATALFILGPAEGMQIATEQGLAATFVQADGAEQSTPAFEPFVAK